MSRYPQRKTLSMESLEARALMAYDVSLSSGVLKIVGSDRNDDVVITADAATNKVTVEIHDIATGQLKKSSTRDLSKVQRLSVELRGGNDELENKTNLPMKALGGAGSDYMSGGTNADQLYGNDGFDYLVGNAGDNILEGGNGSDMIFPGPGNDLMRGGAGGDWYRFSYGSSGGGDVVEETSSTSENHLDFTGLNQGIRFDMNLNTAQTLGPGHSIRITNPASIKGLDATPYGDIIIGSPRNDVIGGYWGDDELYGNGGDDRLFGADGNDRLEGGAGNDSLEGSFGRDRYVFGAGQLGTDNIIENYTDLDLLDFSGFSQGLIVTMNTQILVNNPNLKLSATDPQLLENVIGTAYDDTIVGNGADNMIWGQGGNDTLRGLGGYDVLLGDAGNDHLYSDAVDLLFGGIGYDWFDDNAEFRYHWITPPNPNSGQYRDWGRIF